MKDIEERPLEELVAVRIVKISEVLSRRATRTFMPRYGLRNTDLRMLNILDRNSGITVSELSRITGIDKAWISRSLKSLEEKKLVKRGKSGQASGSVLISLTAKSRKIIEDAWPLLLAREQELLQNIDGDRFRQDLEQLLTNAEASLAAMEE